MIDEKHLITDIEGLKKSPWFNASYISDERRLGIREALDMISSILRKRGVEMDGEKVAKQLEKDVAAYRAGFADGYRVAKAEQIRCKECKHRPSDPHNDQYGNRLEFPDDVCPCQCGDPWYNYMPEDDWYCASAERKEE